MPKVTSITCLLLLLFTVTFCAHAETQVWSNVTTLSAPESFGGQVAISADGNKAIAVWTEHQQLLAAVASISGNAATWSEARALAASSHGGHKVALSSDGSKALLLWSDGKRIDAIAASIAGNVPVWGRPRKLARGAIVTVPSIALSSDGTTAIAVWQRFVGRAYLIEAAAASISGNNPRWGKTTAFSPRAPSSWDPQAAISADGRKAVVVWQHYNIPDTVKSVIRAATGTISGKTVNWGRSHALSRSGGQAVSPQVALSLDGSRAIAAWGSASGSGPFEFNSGVIGRRTARWGRATDFPEPGKWAQSPKITISADGSRATALWHGSGGYSGTALYSASAAIVGTTTTWGPSTTLYDGSSGLINLTLSSDGNRATALWGGGGTVASRIATIANSNQTWTVPALLDQGVVTADPHMASSADGGQAIALWWSEPGLRVATMRVANDP